MDSLALHSTNVTQEIIDVNTELILNDDEVEDLHS